MNTPFDAGWGVDWVLVMRAVYQSLQLDSMPCNRGGSGVLYLFEMRV